MEQGLLERGCGLDVHQKTVVACAFVPDGAGGTKSEVRTFKTVTEGLLELIEWLEEQGVKDVAMEATASYWKPVYNLMEGKFRLVVVNPHYMKLLPGRKTDVKDSEWIAWLLQRGMLRGSAIPTREQRELRELTRYRTSLVRERVNEVNRIQKVLQGANIKLASVASDVVGVSGMAMLKAMVENETDAEALAALARGKLKDKSEDLKAALTGTLGDHQRFVLGVQLEHLADLDKSVAKAEAEIATRTKPEGDLCTRLDTIPGVGEAGIPVVLAEVGTSVAHFPTAGHLNSWGGMAPGQNESAGKRRRARTRKGSPHLRAMLVQAAHGAGRSHSALGRRYRTLAGRIGKKRAAVAVGRMILTIIYYVIRDGVAYDDSLLKPSEDKRERLAATHVAKLKALGYNAALTPIAAATG